MTQIYDVNVKNIQALPTPREYLESLPITDAVAETVRRGRRQIADIMSGKDKRMLVIVGPCSIHDLKAGTEYANRLKELARRYEDQMLVSMRVYFEKPRTTVGWKGMVYDPHMNSTYDITTGLRMAREFLLNVGAMGLAAATEFVDPITPQYIADLVSWGAIGARTAESQTHREMASGLSMPIGFKNGTGGSVQLAVDGVVASQAAHAFLGVDGNGKASIVMTKGNPNCHIVLRGGSRGPNYDATSIADAVALLKSAKVRTQLIVDCSHANSNKDHTRQAAVYRDLLKQRLAGNEDIVGIMLESHLNPGAQKLDERDPSKLKYGVSITDACIGWDETAALLAESYETLKSRQQVSAGR
ncbi:MAG: 3-deoxy-7-phosphoheptulonate synthase [Dehalococcoidia bacterium]|nr:3-deoxy-7-phosphoheptulonate synthase [Dehalococcoidia bacterium]